MMTMEKAQGIIGAGIVKAKEIGQPMNIAVVDAGANLKALARLDGAWLMKVRFVVALVGSALGLAPPAFADEALTAASASQDAIPGDSDSPTGHQAIKDHHVKRSKKQHPKTPEEAGPKSAPSSVSEAKQDPPASGDTNGSSNAANSPTEPRLTFQYWNYYAPYLNENSNWAENGIGRILIPFQIDGIQQIFHIIPPVVTDPNSIRGPRTGLGDIQLYNFSLTKFALPESQVLTVGAGPLLAVPTANSPNFGPDNTVQGGAGGVIEARLNWGILGVLATYQHTLSGVGSQLVTVQPILYYNFQQGWYFRSDAVMQFNSYSHTNVVPVGLGFGKVIQLESGYTWNAYVEAQPSVYRSGRGAPDLQIEAGIQVQFPASVTSGWKF